MVTSVEAKLGLSYAHPIAQGTLKLDAGYQVVNYLMYCKVKITTSTGLVRGSDFGLYGPYFWCEICRPCLIYW